MPDVLDGVYVIDGMYVLDELDRLDGLDGLDLLPDTDKQMAKNMRYQRVHIACEQRTNETAVFRQTHKSSWTSMRLMTLQCFRCSKTGH